MDIRKIIYRNAVRILYQPIYDLKEESIVGYEALARGPEGSPVEGANRLFKAAKEEGLKEKLEMACFQNAVREFRAKLNLNGKYLFLNLHPETFVNNCNEILEILEGIYEKTVLEISEASSEIRYVTGCLNRIKEAGVRVALDDIGAGDRSLSNLCELKADYLKIDRGIIQGLTKVKSGDAEYYRLLLRYLVELAERKGARVIAEGVETKNQLLETMMSGISLVQGFYFSKPQPAEALLRKAIDKQANVKGCFSI